VAREVLVSLAQWVSLEPQVRKELLEDKVQPAELVQRAPPVQLDILEIMETQAIQGLLDLSVSLDQRVTKVSQDLRATLEQMVR